MATATKPNFADPLDLIKSQRCSASDVLGWIDTERREARLERRTLEELNPTSVEAHLARLRVRTHDDAVDRLVDQYRLMTGG